MRQHRSSMLVWAVGGAAAMWLQALAIAEEMRSFPGGAAALAQSVTAGAEAIRPLRWPAERLDTLGGYLTYHNVVMFNLLLAIYGAVVGAKALRRAEERHSDEEVLATGVARRALLGGRTCGFLVIATVIALSLTVGTALGMAGGGEPDLAGSLVTGLTTGLVSVVGFALGVLMGQVAHDSRSAAGLASLLLVVLYVATNMDGEVVGAGTLAAVSPFTLANRSRALVPGYGLDLPATLTLALVAALLLMLTAAAYERRDYGAPLWRGHPPRAQRPRPSHVPRFMLGSVAGATLRHGAVGLVVWAAATAGFTAMMGALLPDVIDLWSEMGFLEAFGGGGGAEASYWTFLLSLLPVVLASYVVTQASGWVNELQHGRVEMMRAAGVSWTRLVTGRILAAWVGCAVVVAVTTAALAAAAAAVGSPLDPSGAGRVVVTALLFAAAAASVAALVTALVRRPLAVTVLAATVGVSYLLTYFVPLFGWPDWLNRLSPFWAFGTPYSAWPASAQLSTLVVVAVTGGVAAVLVAERSPSVP